MMKFTGVFDRVGEAVAGERVDPDVGNEIIAALAAGKHELRVWVDTANEFGHHSTTMNMLKRTIGFGFTGPVRVFVALTDAAKLELFLPGYTAGAAQLVYQGVTINFQYQGVPPDPQPLLISGGSEAGTEELKARLAGANCGFYLQLQPWFWKSLDQLFFVESESGAVTNVILDGQPTLGGRSYTFHAYTELPPARNDAIWDSYSALPKFTKRVAMAKMIADAAPDVYLQPTYGLASRSSKWAALLTLILGGLATQDLMASLGMPVRPIILLVFDGMEEPEWPLMEAWLTGTADDDECPGPLTSYVVENKVIRRLGFQYLDDTGALKDQLAYLQGNRLLVVAMPSCPDEIFRYFYGTASLPCVFEGRGTQNLVLNTGQPYLCTNSDGFPGPAFNEHAPPAAGLAHAVVSSLQGLASRYDTKVVSDFPSMRYANALCALLRDPGALDYFRSLAASYRDPAHDKLRMALRYLRSVPGWTL
ncbi:hypothetical protein [Actinoplanes sp. NPDC049265]|uniref:hypothetical protein n=1 Tax=Actinoplanes sp. NPDC049265 TaxID=3363902 RepID=UPI0037178FC6